MAFPSFWGLTFASTNVVTGSFRVKQQFLVEWLEIAIIGGKERHWPTPTFSFYLKYGHYTIGNSV